MKKLPKLNPKKLFYTVQDAGATLGVSAQTLRRWDREGILVTIRTAGNQRRYSYEQLKSLRENGARKERLLGLQRDVLHTISQSPVQEPAGQSRPPSQLPIKEHSETENEKINISENIKYSQKASRTFWFFLRPRRTKILVASLTLCLLTTFSGVFVAQQIAKKLKNPPVFIKSIASLPIKLASFLSPPCHPERSEGSYEAQYSHGEDSSPSVQNDTKTKSEDCNSLGRFSSEEIAQVLAEGDYKPDFIFKVNVPSQFVEDAKFDSGFTAINIATLAGGIDTQNEDIDAGRGTLTAGNVIYSLTAGTGISVTAGQNPTISNTDLGSSQNIFKKIKVGSDTFSAGSNSDTLTFAAGSNIGITTDTTNKKLTIAVSGSLSQWTTTGSDIYYNTGNVGIGLTAPTFKLDVSGTLRVTGATTLNGVAYTWPSADGGSGALLSTNGSGTLSWLSTSSVNFWQRNSGALAPLNITDDLLLGATSTTSAKFGFLNNAGGTPTATISANSGNNAVSLTGLGVLSTTNAQTLTLGNSSTGNIVIDSGSSSITLSDNTTVSGNITVSGTTGLTLSGSGAGITFSSSGNHDITAGSGGTLRLGALTLTGAVVGGSQNVTGLGTLNGLAITADTGTITTGTWNGTAIATQYGGTGQNFSSTAQGNILYFSGAGTMAALAPGTSGYVLTTNGAGANPSWADLTTSTANFWRQTSGALYPSNTTVDLLVGGTSTSSAKFAFINVNSGNPTATISGNLSLAVPNTAGANTFNLLNNSTFNIQQSAGGDAGLTSRLFINNGGNIGIGITAPLNTLDILHTDNGFGGIKLQSSLTDNTNKTGRIKSGHYDFDEEPVTMMLAQNTSTANNLFIGGGSASENAATTLLFRTGATTSTLLGSTRMTITSDGNVGIGTTVPSAPFHVSADPIGRAAVIFDRPASQFATEQFDIFTASFSGTTRFVIDYQGNVGINASQPINGYPQFGPQAALDVRGIINTAPTASISANSTNATMILNNNGSGDLFTASASGITRFTILNNGNIGIGTITPNQKLTVSGNLNLLTGNTYKINNTDVLSGTTLGTGVITSSLTTVGTIGTGVWQGTSVKADFGGTGVTTYATGDLLYSGSVNPTALTKLTIGTTDQVLTVSGGIPVWADAGTQAFGLWQQISGTIQPKNQTQDLLLGGTATSSAKFAVLNVNSGTPTASVSSGLSGTASYLTADGTLSSANRLTLTLGGTNTGNIVIDSGSSSITLSDATTITGDLAVNSDDLTTNQTSFNLINTTATTLSLGGAATTALNIGNGASAYTAINIGSGNGGNTINLGTGTGADTINIGTNATSANTVNIGTGAVANTIAIGSSSTTTLSLTDDNWSISAAGVSLMSLGAVGAPSYSFTGDTNTGLWSSTAETLNLSTNGVERARVDSSGNIGINTTTPLATLDVRGNINTTPTASVSANSTFAALVVDNRGSGDLFTASSSGLNRFVITQNGNVGIGTAAPDAFMSITSTVNQNLFRVNDNGAGDTSPFVIAADGNVGVGTTTPTSAKFQLSTSVDAFRADVSGSANGLVLVVGSGTGVLAQSANGVALRAVDTGSSGKVLSVEASVGTATLAQFFGGGVGIGTTTPLTSLHITGRDAKGRAALIVDQTAASTADIFTASASGTTRFLIQNDGNVGIGTTAPSWRLHVADSQTATAAATIHNTAANQTAGHTGLIVKMGADGSATDTNDNDAFIKFLRGDGRRKGQIIGSSTGVVYETGQADFAEYFRKEDESQVFSPGELVCIGPHGGATTCSISNTNVLGAISDWAAFVGRGDHAEDPAYVLVGLVGQLPVKVTDANGEVKAGDALTASSLPGYAGKATQAGYIIGRALEGYDPQNPPADGRLLIAMQPVWYDPSIFLTDSGDLNIFAASPEAAELGTFSLRDRLSSSIEKKGFFSSAVIANLKAGSLELEKLKLKGVDLTELLSEHHLSTESAELSSAIKVLGDRYDELSGRLATLEQKIDEQSSHSATLAESTQSFLEQLQNSPLYAASGSAEQNLAFQGDALQDLDISSAAVTGNLSVLGRTVLTDLGVTGKINAGTIAINGEEGSINTIGQPLKLQTYALSSIDIFNGKITFHPTGNITTVGSIIAKDITVEKISTDKLQITTASNVAGADIGSSSAILNASAGTITFKKGQVQQDITTTALTEKSLIFVTPEEPIAIGSKKKDKDIFTIILSERAESDIKVNWWIVN